MRAIVNRKLSFGVLAGTLLAAGCGSNQGTGLLVLSISADPQLPDEAASKLVISYPGGANHVYPGKFPPKDRSTLPLKLQVPNLPASDTPVTFTVQGFDASGCAVTKPATTGAVVIKAGAETAPISVTLVKSDASCADGGVPIGSADGGSTTFDGAGNGIDGTPSGVDGTVSTGTEAGVAVADGLTPDAFAIDSTKDSPPPNSAEVGNGADGTDAINPARAEVADAPLGSETGSDVPIGGGGATGAGGVSGSGGGTGTGGTAVGGATGSGGIAAGGATGAGGGTNASGGTATGGTTDTGGATGTGGASSTGGASGAISGGTVGAGGVVSTGGTNSSGATPSTGGLTGTGGSPCLIGQTSCNSSCVDLQTSNANCGTCGNVCSTTSPSTVQCTLGRCLTTLVTGQSNPSGIAVDATNVYWGGDTAVSKVPLGGGLSTPLDSRAMVSPNRIAVNATNIYYWVNISGVPTVVMMALAAGSRTTIYGDSSLEPQHGLIADATGVYFALYDVSSASGTDAMIHFNGTNLEEARIGSFIRSFTLYAGNLYVGVTSTTNLNYLMLADTTFAPITSIATALAADATGLYYLDGSAGNIWKYSLDGSKTISGLGGYTHASSGDRLVVDESSIYWTVQGTSGGSDGSILKMPLGGGTTSTIASGLFSPTDIALDGTSVYWTNKGTTSSTGTVMKLSPK